MTEFLECTSWSERVTRPISWKGVDLKDLTLTRRQWVAFDEAVEITGGSEVSVFRNGQTWCTGKGVDVATHLGPWVEAFTKHWLAFDAEMNRVKTEHDERMRSSPDACQEHRRLMLMVLLAECESIRERYVHRGIWLADLGVPE